MKTPDELLVYIRYLRSRIDSIEAGLYLGAEQVGPLQGEVRMFRERASSIPFVSTVMRNRFASIQLEIAPVHLEGSSEHFRSTWWLYLPIFKYFLPSRRQRDREIIETELSALRTNLYELFCCVEAAHKNPNKPESAN